MRKRIARRAVSRPRGPRAARPPVTVWMLGAAAALALALAVGAFTPLLASAMQRNSGHRAAAPAASLSTRARAKTRHVTPGFSRRGRSAAATPGLRGQVRRLLAVVGAYEHAVGTRGEAKMQATLTRSFRCMTRFATRTVSISSVRGRAFVGQIFGVRANGAAVRTVRHPLSRLIAALRALRVANPTLRRYVAGLADGLATALNAPKVNACAAARSAARRHYSLSAEERSPAGVAVRRYTNEMLAIANRTPAEFLSVLNDMGLLTEGQVIGLDELPAVYTAMLTGGAP